MRILWFILSVRFLCARACVDRQLCAVCRCGYATLHHVVDKSKEDRMESFFLSETCKYLYLVNALLPLTLQYKLILITQAIIIAPADADFAANVKALCDLISAKGAVLRKN